MHQENKGHAHPVHNPKLSQFDPEHPYIPLTMFLVMPGSTDEYFVGENKSMRRFLFQGTANTTYTAFQRQKYKELIDYWEKNKAKLPANIVNNPFWNEAWKMRWLTSQAYDVKNAIKAMEAHTNYLATNRINVTPAAEKYLKQGLFYVSGRDAYYRPILVFDIDKMIKSKISQQDLLDAQKFFFQRVMNQYLLPGQVQTWAAIIDVGYQNLSSLISPMKSSFGFLANTYRNRMKIAYVVRIPGALSFLWRIIKAFLHQDTAKKINFIDEQEVAPLLQYTNPSQLQKKYGGTQEQITDFWPPRTVQELQKRNLLNFSHPDIVTVPLSQQAYKTKFEKGKLEGHVVSKILIEDEKKIQQQQRASMEKAARLSASNFDNAKVQANGLSKDAIEPVKINWPVQYKPLTVPAIREEDCIKWETLLY